MLVLRPGRVQPSLGRHLAGVALFFASSLATVSASAFCRTTTCGVANPPAGCAVPSFGQCYTTGAPLYWIQGCVSYDLQWNGSPLRGISYEDADPVIASAFALWPSASCPDGLPSIAVQNLGPSYCVEPEFNPEGPNSNSVLFVDHGWPEEKAVAIALTTVSFDPKTGRIYSADIEINTQNFPLGPEQLKQVVAHEAGHFLGLDHADVPGENDAVMFRSYDFNITGLELALKADDVAAICSVYPPSRVAACDPEPEKGFSPECGGDVEASCGLAPESGRSPGTLVVAGLLLAFFVFRRTLLQRKQGEEPTDL